MKILVACEMSGVVREAFKARGHDAWSCDLVPSEIPGQHIQGDAIEAMQSRRWDMLLVFPPCTDLCVSGARWFRAKRANGQQQKSIAFFLALANADCPRVAVENPIGIMSTHFRKPDQIIQPWMFGHGETKGTCLWLKGLPKLVPTNLVAGREQRIWKMGPSPERAKERSRTFQGIAEAMAAQWGAFP